MKNHRVLAFVIGLDIVAVVMVVMLFPYSIDGYWQGLTLLATLAALGGASPVRIPSLKTSVSATDPFVFAALAAFGPMPACVVAGAGVVGATFGKARHRRPIHVAFNLGNVVGSTAAAAAVYLLCGGQPGGSVWHQVWPLLIGTTVYFLLNTGLVTSAIVLDTRRSFLRTWRDSGLWTGVSAYAGLTLATLMLWALKVVGTSGLALGIPPCWLLVAFYRSHKHRQEAQQARIDQIQELNSHLEDKVEERTRELQRALTHIESANTQLRMANERLTDANHAKSEFLASVSHELRTPLNAVIGFSELLADDGFGELNEQQREFVRDIHESGEHLLGLINEILDLSKIEAGKMELHLEPVQVAGAVHEAVAMLRPQAGKKQLTLEERCPVENVASELDPGMFRQLLINLLSNAVKFTPDGGRVSVIAEREGRDLVVHVEDTGIGIESEDCDKIFQEFYQVDGSYARTYGGTGLGLALVRRMVEMQGGAISVRSTKNVGSRFTCRFSGSVLDDVPPTVADVVRTECAGPEPIEPRPVVASTDGADTTIMVVEDNPVNRKLAINALRSHGFTVLAATSGEEALRLLRQQPTDLVLMDIQLPGMDGLEVTRRLKDDPLTADMPVVALTAHAREADEANALAAGCVGYIMKPIRLARFPAQVQSYLAADPAPA